MIFNTTEATERLSYLSKRSTHKQTSEPVSEVNSALKTTGLPHTPHLNAELVWSQSGQTRYVSKEPTPGPMSPRVRGNGRPGCVTGAGQWGGVSSGQSSDQLSSARTAEVCESRNWGLDFGRVVGWGSRAFGLRGCVCVCVCVCV